MKLNYLSMMYLRMHAKHLLIFSALFLLLFTTQSCTKEPNEVYTVEIANESTSAITLKGFLNGQLQSEEVVLTGKKGLKKSYSDYYFSGYYNPSCKLDSVSILFENKKGYISVNQDDINRKLSIKPNLFTSGYRKVGKNHYRYMITEEHYKNAHVLP